MGITVGSWWIDSDGRRMTVIRVPHSEGRTADRYPCYLEGRRLYLAWLSEPEIRGAWRHWRPRIAPDCYVPSWVRGGDYGRDVSFSMEGESVPLWLTVHRICRGWVCLVGMTQDRQTHETHVSKLGVRSPVGRFDWSLQRYDVFFLPLAEALSRMGPRFTRPTQWDRIAGEDDPISPQPRITPFTHDGPRDSGSVDDGLDLELS